ncbi:MAG: DUF5685 family protein [Oscillospiraceae bacterium]|nr:DUF5685 family protein [Oscillospiraceae bacterium]
MFGSLTAGLPLLTEEQLRRYKACYCGLCRSLRERFGLPGALALNYDTTFLALLLTSLYEPDERSGEDACAAHPFRPRSWWRSEYSDYAADMTAALAYLKCRDDWKDEGDPAALTEGALLRKGFKRAQVSYPRQCGAMETALAELGEVERRGLAEPDAAAACFGRLLGEVFCPREDRWAPTLRRFGEALGRCVYILDACLDLDRDALLNRYNPLRRFYGQDNAARFREILQLLLSDAVREFDRLPLVQDAALMQNILCVGLWSAFDRKYGSEEGKPHGPGSL